MSDTAIRVEGLGKQYRIGAKRERYKALRDKLSDAMLWPARVAQSLIHRNGNSGHAVNETFWALKGVSFEVKRGEVVGVIGRNGAGKSTLLKILSRITEPSEGCVEIRGRVGSLLEVGTGFHPELTGRENIYLNGAILGMKKAEIERKFDEIVAFAEIEKFIDTMVKHYSSGMYLRLAFAVAAHLEPEILLVDEVLAVGDLAFQDKCLGKMGEVASQGRTVLFVSHNMAAVKSLTRRGLLLMEGHVAFDGTAESAVQGYVQLAGKADASATKRPWGRGSHTVIRTVRLLDAAGESTPWYTPGEPLRVAVELETDGTSGMSLEVFLVDASRSRIGMASTYQFHGRTLPSVVGAYVCRLELQPMWLASGRYAMDATTSVINVGWDHYVEAAFQFDVAYSNPLGHQLDFKQGYGFGPLALLSLPQARFDPIPVSWTGGDGV